MHGCFRSDPTINYGICTGGPSDLIVLDVDVGKGGEESLEQLREAVPEIDETAVVQTGSGGWHYFFADADGLVRNSASKLGPGLDIRGEGGYVVGPGSRHASGGEYSWELSSGPSCLAPLPAGLRDRINQARGAAATENRRRTGEVDLDSLQSIPVDERFRRAVGYVSKMAAAISGDGGHDATFKVAVVVVLGFALPEAEAFRLLRDHYNPRCQPPWSDEELLHKIRSAAEKGHSCPLGYLLTGEPNRTANDAETGEAPTEPTPSRWYGRQEIVDLIQARVGERWVDVGLGLSVIARVRPGGLITLSGPSGGGKTSLACCLILQHALQQGFVFVLSRELTADEFGARAICIAARDDSLSWEGVLRGKLEPDAMVRNLPERLRMLDRKRASLENLDEALHEYRKEEPDGPVLFVVDYGQIMAGAGDDPRQQVGDVWEECDDIARKHRAVGLILSQMSRANSRAARAGDRLGVAALDGGAESAAIERYSTVVLEIGAFKPADDYGRQEAFLSLAKGRMGGGDLVVPMSYEGRTGRWTVTGDPRPASDVQAEARSARSGAKLRAAVLAMAAFAAKAEEPVTREELRSAASVSRTLGKQAVDQALDEGVLVEVQRKRPRSGSWMLWTLAQADAAGVPIIQKKASSC